MKRWTVVLMTKGHRNSTGEYAFSVRAQDEPRAIEQAYVAFQLRDSVSHKPSRLAQRKLEPTVKEVICWF